MKSLITIIFLVFCSSNIFSQGKIEKMKSLVLKEGFLLYESEKASWHGGDLFIKKFKDEAKVGGYVSYTDGDDPKCVFISKEDKSKVIGTVTFDKTFDLNKANVDLTERKVNDLEQEYLNLRDKTFERIKTDTIFKYYKNTGYNVVPLIIGNEKKTYVLTASKESGKVIFGNDYLIDFDRKGNVKKSSRLHKGMLVFEYGGDKQMVGVTHSHLPEYNEIITPTDICTTMLYKNQTGWETNYVISKNYVSIWDCKKNELVVMTMEAWEKINESNN